MTDNPQSMREAFERAMPEGYSLKDRPSGVGCSWGYDEVWFSCDKYWNAVKAAWEHRLEAEIFAERKRTDYMRRYSFPAPRLEAQPISEEDWRLLDAIAESEDHDH